MNGPLRLACLCGLSLLPCSTSSAPAAKAERSVVYVNNQTGSDAFDGRVAVPGGDGQAGPFKTIMQAVRQCPVGATIELANTGADYRETVSIEGFKKGRAETPLIIDGHGAYVSGLVEVSLAQWVLFKDDVYYFLNKVGDADFKPRAWYERKLGDAVYGAMPNSNWLGFEKRQGWFTEPEAPEIFMLNGKPGPNSPKLEELQPGGFFYDAQAATLKAPAGQRCLFFRLPAGKELRECVVELPLNQGVYVSDDYVTVCNLGSRYSQDDGFAGFWGQGVVLRNIHACFNCDQGVSFHGNSSTLIDGALIERNAGCGIADVMSCTTIYRNSTIRGNYPCGVLFQGFSHAMYNCRVLDNRGPQIQVGTGASGSFVNCLVVGRGAKVGGAAVSMEYGRLDHCTIVNSPVGVEIAVGGTVRSSVIANCGTAVRVGKGAQARVSIVKSLLDLGEADFEGTKVGAAAWGEFVKGFKGGETATIAAPGLAGPLFQLPPDSPYLKAGENGTVPGVNLPPATEPLAP